MTEIVCNACRSTQISERYRFDDRSLYRCNQCGLEFIHPIPEHAEQLYGEYYLSIDGVGREVGYDNYFADRELLQREFVRRIELIEQQRPPGSLLEIGCAAGFFLDAALQRGWSTMGIEISEQAARYAREQLGLDVRQGTIEQFELEPESFDAAVLNDTIEHLRDPARAIELIAAALKPGGVLLITTPDTGSAWARLLGRRWVHLKPGEHFHYFSASSLARLLERFGLGLIHSGPLAKGRTLGGILARLNFHRFDNQSRALDWLSKAFNRRVPRRFGVRSGEMIALARKVGG
ncbi:MAG: class I SAM-dependent methyltransferase [Candidatus Alcyoniella australis]|nr:class I SAM-dependent methyltransferase [Candidatus Alcyoniella australis]